MRLLLVTSTLFSAAVSATCIGSGANGSAIKQALSAGGHGAVVNLCPGAVIPIYEAIYFRTANQTIQTEGLPTDSKRAILRIESSSEPTTPTILSVRPSNEYGQGVDNITVRNVILDGNVQNTGFASAKLTGPYGANLELGFGTENHAVSHVTLMNDRGGDGCIIAFTDPFIDDGDNTGMSVTNSTFKNCTAAMYWAGVDFIVAGNTFEMNQGSAIIFTPDAGDIVNSQIVNNTFISLQSSAQVLGAIDLADYGYAVSNLSIHGNRFVGGGYMTTGIVAGNCAGKEQGCNYSEQSGPLSVTKNAFSGNITFPFAVNQWTGGLVVTGNDLSALSNPSSSFTDASACKAPVANLVTNNKRLVAVNVTGPTTFQAGFAHPAASFHGNFYCVKAK